MPHREMLCRRRIRLQYSVLFIEELLCTTSHCALVRKTIKRQIVEAKILAQQTKFEQKKLPSFFVEDSISKYERVLRFLEQKN